MVSNTPPNATILSVTQLTKAFRDSGRGRVLALDHVSFSAQPGEVFGILGPNGAGKTTALRILSTVLKPTGGAATVAAKIVITPGWKPASAGRMRSPIRCPIS